VENMRVNVNDLLIRDPFIFVENGEYYLLGTTYNSSISNDYNKCVHAGSDFMLYKSHDLKVFEKVGCMVEKDTLYGYSEFWAPELHKVNGKYYLIVSVFREDKGRGSVILVSDKINEPFTFLTGEYITPSGWSCLDATIFTYQGKNYLYFSDEWRFSVTKDGDGGIFVVELSQDLKETIGEPKKVISGKNCGFAREIADVFTGEKGYVAEGPFVKEIDGKIELYWSTFSHQGYCVVKNVAKSVFGAYEFERFVVEKDGGHAMIFTGLDKQEYITFHQPNCPPNERMNKFLLEKQTK
jgi:GH43 family beta-xylosidase